MAGWAIALFIICGLMAATSETEVFARIYRLACKRAGLDTTKAAYTQGIDPGQYCRLLDGEGRGVAVAPLYRLPVGFQRERLLLEAEHFGIDLMTREAVLRLLRLIGIRLDPAVMRPDQPASKEA